MENLIESRKQRENKTKGKANIYNLMKRKKR